MVSFKSMHVQRLIHFNKSYAIISTKWVALCYKQHNPPRHKTHMNMSRSEEKFTEDAVLLALSEKFQENIEYRWPPIGYTKYVF